MFDYQKYVDVYCNDNSLDLQLSFDMPAGYENANGTFDVMTKTVFINADFLADVPDYEKLFFLFHELRHAAQYMLPEKFSDEIIHSLQYVIMYDGTCYKLENGIYKMCRLEGNSDFLTDLYLGQPYEMDANNFAYEQVKKICGDSDELKKLYNFWTPRRPLTKDVYKTVFAKIDAEIQAAYPEEHKSV